MGENRNWELAELEDRNFAKLFLLRDRYESLAASGLRSGMNVDALRLLLIHSGKCSKVGKSRNFRHSFAKKCGGVLFLSLGLAAVLLGVFWRGDSGRNVGHGLYRKMLSSRCVLDNNYFVMEVARPITDCSICRNVSGVVVLRNATKETFAEHAYAGRPVLVKGAARPWNATRTFTFDFFKKLYLETEGALESVEEECQFFPFRADFVTLRDVFSMPAERARGLKGEKPWYIGWSNCNPQVTEVLRKHYSRPHFLPDDSESSAIDWIFMGWPGQGASVHLDYVQRPSWQAQISGRKIWRMFPTPECEHVCGSFTIVVEKGDIGTVTHLYTTLQFDGLGDHCCHVASIHSSIDRYQSVVPRHIYRLERNQHHDRLRIRLRC